MLRKFFLFGSFLFAAKSFSQILIPFVLLISAAKSMPEHGYLPGKKFPIYKTIDKFDFKKAKFRVELFDERTKMNLAKVRCSPIEVTNTSEFAKPECIFKVKQYLDSLFNQANAAVDSSSADTIRVYFEVLDSRLIGFGSIKVHGLCQISIHYKEIERAYCVDIVDGDKHSPLGSNAVVTRKTATRYMASAAIREVIEQFFIDLKYQRSLE